MRAQVRRYERLGDHLEYVAEMAKECACELRGFSPERRLMREVISDLEFAKAVVQRLKDMEMKKDA